MHTLRAHRRKIILTITTLNLVLYAFLGSDFNLKVQASPSLTSLFVEDFTSNQYKDFTENVNWDIWEDSLSLERTDSTNQIHPRSAVDGYGNVMVVWTGGFGSGNIYGQRLDENGNKLWEEDAQVNYDNTATYSHDSPEIALDPNGNAIVVWHESRGGNPDIFAQKLDVSGNRLWDADVRVNSDSQGGYQSTPVVATDESGNAIIVWSDDRGGEDIYTQKLDSNGNKLWGNDIRVNSDITFQDQWNAAIAIGGSGEAIIAWHDERNGDPDIYAQILDASGNKQLADDLRVNSDGGTTYQGYPSVAIDEVGRSIIIWDDARNGDSDIYGQKLDGNGNKMWASDVNVNLEARSAWQTDPALTFDKNGNAIVVWVDDRNDYPQIYAQALDQNRNNIWATDLNVSKEFNIGNQSDPDVSADNNGNIFIVWEDQRNINFDIYSQNLSEIGDQEWAVDFRVNSPSGFKDQWAPILAMDASGDAIIAWLDNRYIGDNSPRGDIFGQKINKNGDLLWMNEVKINSNEGSLASGIPSLAVDNNGNMVIVWVDYGSGTGDLFAQKLDENGNKLWTKDIRVNMDFGSGTQDSPAVSMDVDGNAIVVWRYWGDNKRDIYAQKLDLNGAKLWPVDVLVNHDSGIADAWSPAIAIDNSGNSTIVWEDQRIDDGDILAQKIDKDGNINWGTDIRVDSDNGTAGQTDPEITIDSMGNIIIVWRDYRNGNYDIYAQKLNINGNKLWVGDKLVSAESNAEFQFQPSIGIGAKDECVIVWVDSRNGSNGLELYAQRLDTDGNKLWLTDLRVSTVSGISNQSDPAIDADDSENAFIAWVDNRNKNQDIYVQRINQFGEHIWLDDLQLISPDKFYMLTGSAQSRTINQSKGNIQQATLSVDYQSNDGGIEFYLTNNGGLDWFPITPGTTHLFTTVGEDLRWKSILTANSVSSNTPVVEWVHIEYATDQNGTIFIPIALQKYFSYFIGPWEREDNDSYQQANGPILSGKDYYGFHDDRNDYFKVYMTNAGLITVNLSSDHEKTDSKNRPVVQMMLYYLSTADLIDYRIGPSGQIKYDGPAGLYYIRVYTAPEYFDSTKQYTLNVTYP